MPPGPPLDPATTPPRDHESPAPGRTRPEPARGTAVTAFVLSLVPLLVTNLIAVVLAVVVLRRRRDGRDHGKGLAVAALVIGLVLLLLTTALLVVVLTFRGTAWRASELRVGECVDADIIANGADPFVRRPEGYRLLHRVDCTESHDGEVIDTLRVTSRQMRQWRTMRVPVCDRSMERLPVGLTAIALSDGPRSSGLGDRATCVAYRLDGDQLSEPLAEMD